MSPSSDMASALGIIPGMKLYVVTRQDLSPGAQAVQSCHAIVQFTCDHPLLGREWYEKSNTLSLLACINEASLKKLFQDAQSLGIRSSAFFEPDMKNQLTAIALEPSPKTKKLVARLPLTLSSRGR